MSSRHFRCSHADQTTGRCTDSGLSRSHVACGRWRGDHGAAPARGSRAARKSLLQQKVLSLVLDFSMPSAHQRRCPTDSQPAAAPTSAGGHTFASRDRMPLTYAAERSLHDGVDTSTSTGRMVAGILMAIAEYEREL